MEERFSTLRALGWQSCRLRGLVSKWNLKAENEWGEQSRQKEGYDQKYGSVPGRTGNLALEYYLCTTE